MKLNNYMKMEFCSVSLNEEFAKKVVTEFVQQLDPTVEELHEIQIATAEAVGNAIVHAYPNSLGKIMLRCQILNNGMLQIIVKDNGVGIEDIEKAICPMFSTTTERSGMGFTIMEKAMTSCKVKSEVGKGTEVHMEKRLL